MQTRTYKNGTKVHVVRWRANGARHFRQFVSRQEAEAFEASVRLTRANGGTPPADPGATVADLVAPYADDRRLDTLGDVGLIRLERLFSNDATARAGDDTWRLTAAASGSA